MVLFLVKYLKLARIMNRVFREMNFSDYRARDTQKVSRDRIYIRFTMTIDTVICMISFDDMEEHEYLVF